MSRGRARAVLLQRREVTPKPSRPGAKSARSVIAGTIVAGRQDLRVVAAPVDVPGFDMAVVWHERSHRDLAHRWLRERIVAAVRAPGR